VHPQDLIHCKDTSHAGLSATKVKAAKRKNLERPPLSELDQTLGEITSKRKPKSSPRPTREATREGMGGADEQAAYDKRTANKESPLQLTSQGGRMCEQQCW
jgi:hypothetical protein